MSGLTTITETRLSDEAELTGFLDSLLTVLEQEGEVYEELQAILIEKQNVLARPTLERIFDNNGKMETCVLKGKMLEEVRSNIVKKIAQHLQREVRDINITTLISQADEKRAAALKARQKTLVFLIESIKEADGKNRQLLNYSLDYVKNSVNFINNLLSTGADYANSGRLKIKNRNGKILNRKG